jgi:hypothetical protein
MANRKELQHGQSSAATARISATCAWMTKGGLPLGCIGFRQSESYVSTQVYAGAIITERGNRISSMHYDAVESHEFSEHDLERVQVH